MRVSESDGTAALTRCLICCERSGVILVPQKLTVPQRSCAEIFLSPVESANRFSGLQRRATCGEVEQVNNLLYGQVWSHPFANRFSEPFSSSLLMPNLFPQIFFGFQGELEGFIRLFLGGFQIESVPGEFGVLEHSLCGCDLQACC